MHGSPELDRDRRSHQADSVAAFLDQRRLEAAALLFEWAAIPSVSSDPACRADVRRSASWLAGQLRELGFPTAEIWDTGGQPAVFAGWAAAPGAPTALIYGHHDVRGRGATGAKAQVLSHLWGIWAHLTVTCRPAPAVNLTLLVEGEAEVGSAHLGELLRERGDRLRADLVIGRGRPATLLAEYAGPVVSAGTGWPEDDQPGSQPDSRKWAQLEALQRQAATLALLWCWLPDAGLAP